MSDLYPLKFETVLKQKVWGGRALVERFNKKSTIPGNIGESWEISAVSGELSVVSNGFLAGNNIEELTEVYMGDLTGDSVYEKFGNEFPLLVKLIEAREDLSIQVHPGDALAKERHHAFGKTEMWYILESEKGAKLYTGFREGVTREMYQDAIGEGTLASLLNVETAEPGDAFFTPAGRIHAIGAGTVLAEIQQTSDITYRIYDWDRKSTGSEKRELHLDLALDAIDFSAAGSHKIRKEPELNRMVNIVSCEYFHANILKFNTSVGRDYNLIDSFVIYMGIDGGFSISWDNNKVNVAKGETVLLPAMIKEVTLEPSEEATLMEVYIKS